MKRLILTVMFAGLLAPAGLMAQKTYIDGTSVILDLSESAGMPAGAVTTAGKYSSFTPSATVLGTDNDANGSINATVYYKLEVAPHDLTGDGTIGSAGGAFTWVNAFNYCKNVNYNSTTGWRLPTQRELQIMYIFMPALNNLFGDSAVGGTAFSSATYWSSTEHSNATYSWYVFFSTGATNTYVKTNSYRVRCVREIP